MEPETRTLFVDTNGFLQVRDLKDVSWNDLFPSVRSVDLMIAPRVIEELDKHKISTNQRRRDRARLALRLIEEASAAPDLSLVVRETPVRVRIVISIAAPLNWAEYPHLDQSKPDDQLVAEAISSGGGAAVLSFDTGPRIRARLARIDAFAPPDNWLLPVEQTDDQRKISKLERDLEQAKIRFPKIVAGYEDLNAETSEIRVIRPVLSPLDPVVARRLAQEYLREHPRSSLQHARTPYFTISEDRLQSYSGEYSTFETNVHSFFSSLHERVRRIGDISEINYFVRNESGVLAEGLRIEFDIEGRGYLVADRDRDLEKVFSLPKPPEPPSPLGRTHFSFPHVSSLHDAMKPRDPVAFYWFDRPTSIANHSALQCEQFRATRILQDSIFISLLEAPPVELQLHLHISAANLPQPLDISAKLVIIEQLVDWSHPVVRTILPEMIRDKL